MLVSLLLLLLFLATFVTGAIRSWRNTQMGSLRWLGVFGGVLGSLGALGFFGALSLGGILPGWVEWPVGWASGAVELRNGARVVPHTMACRVQAYDRNWRFLKAWPIDSRGGAFEVRPIEASDDEFVVISTRSSDAPIFKVDGIVGVSPTDATAAIPNPSDVARSGNHQWVPTFWVLLPMSGPLCAWISIVVGYACVFAAGGIKFRATARAESFSGDNKSQIRSD